VRSCEDQAAAIISEVVMARSKTGEAIGPKRRSRSSRRTLERFIARAKRNGDLDEWRRGRAVLGYIEGKRVVELAEQLDVTRGSVNRWLQWYERLGIPGIRTRVPPGMPPRLSPEQREELVALIDAGPMAAGYGSGVWTGPMIGDLIEARFGYRYHNHSVPALLHKLGFSVQRPRKRLARADREAQALWLRKRLPAIKKRPPRAVGS
jgi:transposase